MKVFGGLQRKSENRMAGAIPYGMDIYSKGRICLTRFAHHEHYGMAPWPLDIIIFTETG